MKHNSEGNVFSHICIKYRLSSIKNRKLSNGKKEVPALHICGFFVPGSKTFVNKVPKFIKAKLECAVCLQLFMWHLHRTRCDTSSRAHGSWVICKNRIISHEGFEHPWVLGSVEVLEPVPHIYGQMTVFLISPFSIWRC